VGCTLLNKDLTLQTSCVQAFPTPLNQALDAEWLRRISPRSRLWGMAALFANPPSETAVEGLSGACIMMPRAVVEKVGGFTESYFMYGEDLDLCYKVRRAGFIVAYTPHTRLVHLGGGSSAGVVKATSNVNMRQSVYHFLELNRSKLAARTYRFTMALTSVARLLLMAPLMLWGSAVVRHGRGSWNKWIAILLWSVGARAGAIPRPLTAAAVPLSPAKST
jgi:hypothetical protein